MKNKFTLLTITLVLSVLAISCHKDFLEQPPMGSYSEANLSNADGIEKLLIGAYADLNGLGYWPACLADVPTMNLFGSIHGAEAFKGSEAGDLAKMLEISRYDISSINEPLLILWWQNYSKIYRCNLVLRLLPDATNMSDDRKKEVEAEARFLRAHYYFIVKINFRNIPWVDEKVIDVRVPNTDEKGDFVNIWPQITEDMDFARKNLPVIQKDLGRPNKWAADAYYAKIMIYRAGEGEYPNGYSEALAVLNDVMLNGITMRGNKYGLEENYYNNFNVLTENGKEAVFSIQHTVNDGTSPVNPINGDMQHQFTMSQNPNGPGLGTGWGFFQPTPYNVDHFRTDPNGLPYLDMYETNDHRIKDDYGLTMTDPFEPDTCGLDPRLDLQIGRRGVPFLDYGMFSSTWIRSQIHGGPYLMKKYNILKSQIGIYSVLGRPRQALNFILIRYADVLLLAAECEAHAGSLDNARALVNQVRERITNGTEAWVLNEAGTDYAANYRVSPYPTGGPLDPFQTKEGALDAILMERTLELNLEGCRFYDVVRFGKDVEVFNEFLEVEKDIYDYLDGAVYTPNPDRYLPIHAEVINRSQVDGTPTLVQNPGY